MAVLQVGAFLGLGGRLVAVPYESLIIDERGEKIVLPGATREELNKLLEFKSSRLTLRGSNGRVRTKRVL